VVWFGICVCWLVGVLLIYFYFWIGGFGGVGGGLEGRFREGWVGGWGIGWGDWGVVGKMVTLGEGSPCGIYGIFEFLVL